MPPRSAATTQSCNWQASRVVARLNSCRKVPGGGGRHPGGWKNYPGMLRGQKGPASFARLFRVRPQPLCYNLNHQRSKQRALRMNGYIQGSTSSPPTHAPSSAPTPSPLRCRQIHYRRTASTGQVTRTGRKSRQMGLEAFTRVMHIVLLGARRGCRIGPQPRHGSQFSAMGRGTTEGKYP